MASPLQKEEWTFFSRVHGVFTKLDNVKSQRKCIKSLNAETVPATFSGNKVTQSEEAKLPFDNEKPTRENQVLKKTNYLVFFHIKITSYLYRRLLKSNLFLVNTFKS